MPILVINSDSPQQLRACDSLSSGMKVQSFDYDSIVLMEVSSKLVFGEHNEERLRFRLITYEMLCLHA